MGIFVIGGVSEFRRINLVGYEFRLRFFGMRIIFKD